MKIVIVGGGTAGWLVSLYLAVQRPQHDYTTIDSSEIPTVGVGEAVTGKFVNMLEECGVDLYDFMINTHSLPKHGIRFTNWLSTPGYYDSPVEYSVSHKNPIDDRLYWQLLNSQPIEYSSYSGFLMADNRTGWELKDGKLTNTLFHALQFDESMAGKYLKKLAIEKGVRHISETISSVATEDSKIKNLVTKQGSTITADLFIDCSGFSKLLISKLNPEFKDCSEYINVNSAFMFKVLNDVHQPKCFVNCIARNNGWNFEITTRHRTGRGYLYNSNICSKEDIIKELTEAYGPISEVKTIHWTPGSLVKVWIGNVIAMGLSASFLEPLQAGTIHDCLMQVKDLVETGLVDNSYSEEMVNAYNERSRRLFDDYLDLINICYATDREDTEFWKFAKNKQKITARAERIIELAKCRLTRELDFDKFMGYGSQGLYNYSLAGLNIFDKTVIAKVFDANRIDTQRLEHEQLEFEKEQKEKLKKLLTTEELNTILHNESLTLRA